MSQRQPTALRLVADRVAGRRAAVPAPDSRPPQTRPAEPAPPGEPGPIEAGEPGLIEAGEPARGALPGAQPLSTARPPAPPAPARPPVEPPAGPPEPGSPAEPAPAGQPATGAAAGSARTGWRVAGGACCLLALLALGFAADLLLLGGLRHARDQQTRYADFRFALANGLAPVGPVDPDGARYRPGTPVALVEIPQLGLREVVLEGTAAGVLRSGPGHRRDTALPGQPGTSVLMGRRAAYGGPFRHLDELRAGDTFTVTTGQGRHEFRVLGLRRAGDPQPPPLAAGQGRLTLVTTTGSTLAPDGVLRVDAELTSPVRPAPARAAQPLPPAEQAMGTDPGVWVPLVLYGQALLLAAVAVTWARARWGRWQAWVAGVPVLAALGLAVADQAAGLLPNLI